MMRYFVSAKLFYRLQMVVSTKKFLNQFVPKEKGIPENHPAAVL